jgi:hypothetical protein
VQEQDIALKPDILADLFEPTCIPDHSGQAHAWGGCLCEVDHQVHSHGVARVTPAAAKSAAAQEGDVCL